MEQDHYARYSFNLVASRTATGLEWRLRIGNLWPPVPKTGIFTDHDVSPQEVLPRVLRKVMADEGEL